MVAIAQSPSALNLELTQTQALCFDQFFEHRSEDGRYELVDGRMVKILATREHYDTAALIQKNFEQEIDRLKLNYVVNNVAMVLTTNKNQQEQGRPPDVSVINRDIWRSDRLNYQGIREPIQVAVEVVSSNWEDDYIDKLNEYEQCGIPEYWIVDYLALGSRSYLGYPKQPSIFVFTLDIDRKYKFIRFQNAERIISPTFPQLNLPEPNLPEINLTVEQVLAA